MIQKIRVVGGIAVVTATAEFHPLRQLKQLANELEAIGFKGNVLFDLLAVNGLAENRFASIDFTGHEFDKASFAVESDVNQNIKSEQNSFAKTDKTFLLGSVLSSNEIEKFTH
ncbi:type II toxin-antitoxin system RnlB family antitoxin [Halomonas sp. AOP12-C2-37]|uniref:type II toxin-antitoxin system RnlB family antitoxin n=1 Tax=unclassified Halomonas TaxID=2609666 RepID=UPI0040343725